MIIVDLPGRVVESMPINRDEARLDVRHYPGGRYHVLLETKGHRISSGSL